MIRFFAAGPRGGPRYGAGHLTFSVLTRAHLRSLAPLPKEELLALKRTLGELGSIGRNLNQIAHAANQGQLVTGPGRNDLEAMLCVCGALRDNLKQVLLANLKSWERGSP